MSGVRLKGSVDATTGALEVVPGTTTVACYNPMFVTLKARGEDGAHRDRQAVVYLHHVNGHELIAAVRAAMGEQQEDSE